MIGLIDADLLYKRKRFPNLALMKLSSFYKQNGYDTSLLFNYDNINDYEMVLVSKVFEETEIPVNLMDYKNVTRGGTGFFWDKAPNLPYEIEHIMPDYHLYDTWVQKELDKGINKTYFYDYQDYSIGFATRGCFRKCGFCVNKKYSGVIGHAHINEFLDKSRKYIYLWDDNILGYHNWYQVFEELYNTGKNYNFRQGLDIRCLTEQMVFVLRNAKYIGDIIFSFDSIKYKNVIEDKLKLWRSYSNKNTKLYLLCAYESTDVTDIVNIFERVKILMRYRCLPYLMRFKGYNIGPMAGMYITLARWLNQPFLFKKVSFKQYCYDVDTPGKASKRYIEEFTKQYPDIAEKYFDMRYEEECKNV
jgi:hypothetical protein